MALIFVVLTLALLGLRWVYKKTLSQVLGLVALYFLCIVFHLISKGYRWPYLLVYTVPLLLMVDLGLDYIKKPIAYACRLIWLLPVVGFVLILAFPKVSLTGPQGPYRVGTMVMNLEDYEREDIYDPKGGPRDVRVQVFYPTDVERGHVAPWFLDGEVSVGALANSYGLPKVFLSHLTGVQSHSFLDVAVSEAGPFPVVIMSHGWGSSRILHLNLSEMLASNGYIVFAIDHAYAAAMTRNKEGAIISHKADILPEKDYLDEAEKMIQVFSQDVALTRDHIDFLQDVHPLLKGKLDVDKLALMGHSTGGGGMVYYAMDHDVEAVIGLDAWVEPITDLEHLTMPTLFLRSQAWQDLPNNDNLKKLTYSVYTIADSMHQDFSIAEHITPVQKLIKWSGDSSLHVQETMILRYLDKVLKAKDDMLDFENLDRVKLTHP